MLPSLAERIVGRLVASEVVHPETGEVIVGQGEEIDEAKVKEIADAGITSVHVRSPLSCLARQGVCQRCYGRDLGRGHLVDLNTAAGVIAAQSIGEPGTQLTLRTFHTGGVAGLDITTGLPRVEELFEARTPKSQAIISEISGIAEVTRGNEGQSVKVLSSEPFRADHPLPPGYELMVGNGDWVDVGAVLAIPPAITERPASAEDAEASTELAASVEPVVARVSGQVVIENGHPSIAYTEMEEREYAVPAATRIRVQSNDVVHAGQQLTDGSVNPQDTLHVLGREAVQQYLVDEVQKVYRSQGVVINDKHIEVIVRQMLSKVRIDSSGDTELVPGELMNRFQFEDVNAKVLAEGGEAAIARPLLLGITRAALSTSSWLAAASFQETTKVLTEAAVKRATDRLIGLKENVIIGRLIPARYKPIAPLEELPARVTSVEESMVAALVEGEGDSVATLIEEKDELPAAFEDSPDAEEDEPGPAF